MKSERDSAMCLIPFRDILIGCGDDFEVLPSSHFNCVFLYNAVKQHNHGIY